MKNRDSIEISLNKKEEAWRCVIVCELSWLGCWRDTRELSLLVNVYESVTLLGKQEHDAFDFSTITFLVYSRLN